MPKASRGPPVPLSDATVEMPPAQLSECTSCAGGTLHREQVKTALWRGDDLVVIEDIPALVCQRCGERYFEDETAMALDMMRTGDRADAPPRHTITVPVYAFHLPGVAEPDKGKT